MGHVRSLDYTSSSSSSGARRARCISRIRDNGLSGCLSAACAQVANVSCIVNIENRLRERAPPAISLGFSALILRHYRELPFRNSGGLSRGFLMHDTCYGENLNHAGNRSYIVVWIWWIGCEYTRIVSNLSFSNYNCVSRWVGNWKSQIIYIAKVANVKSIRELKIRRVLNRELKAESRIECWTSSNWMESSYLNNRRKLFTRYTAK